MKITSLPANQLTPAQIQAWADIQRDDPALHSPFLHPGFTLAVAAVRKDVEVAVLEEDGVPVGFLPFQRGWWGAGRPVGGRMCDYQALIARPGIEWNVEEVLRACRLSSWHFDHLLASQLPFKNYHYSTGNSPCIDVSRGFEGYEEEKKRSGSQIVRETMRRTRKIEREIGPIRFEADSRDPQILASLIEWKRAQYRRTRAPDVFSYPWTLQLVERILRETADAFRAKVSALHVGDHLVAVELSLRSHDVLHGWFPAYNQEFGAYTPGMILAMYVIKAAAPAGVRRLELGKGAATYKDRLMTGGTLLAEGSVTLNPLNRLVRRGLYQTRAWARSSPLASAVRVVGRLTRPLRGWLAFR